MLLSPACTIAALLATIVNACTICTNESPEPIELFPAPWTLRGDIYMVLMLPGLLPETGLPLLPTSSANLPAKAFPPFERQYPASIAGEYVGKIGLIQVLRYTESPVGPYDELLIVPGFFGYQNNGKYEEGIRVSRIYVSQKYTAWNGRHNWNIPKHLARFDWTYSADGSANVKIYPFDTSSPSPNAEAYASAKPFLQMTFSPLLPENLLNNTLSALPLSLSNILGGVNLNPQIPFTTDLYALLGIDTTLKQPPIPQGADAFGAITDGGPYWKSVVPGQHTDQATIGTIDLDQTGGDVTGDDEFYQNFWPGLPRLNVGIKMANAVITFGVGEEMPGAVA